MGTAAYLKEKNPTIRTSIVEPEGSILGGGASHGHKTEGIGMEFIPKFLNKTLIDQIYTISDEEALLGKSQILDEKGFFILPSELFCNIRKGADKNHRCRRSAPRRIR